MSSDNTSHDRLVAIEMALAHLQNDVQQMHEVLLSLQQELRVTHRQVGTLEGKLLAMEAPLDPERPVDEKPPHY